MNAFARLVTPQDRFQFAGGRIGERAAAAENHRAAALLDILIQQRDLAGSRRHR